MEKLFLKLGVIFFLVTIILAGCKEYDRDYEIFVSDKASLLQDETITWLKNHKYPKGYVFAVQTRKNISPIMIGAVADDLFEKTKKEHSNEDAFAKYGVLLVVSANPNLVQVRVGTELYTPALWKGITAGSKYISHQEPSVEGRFDYTLKEMVGWLSISLPDATNIPWYRDWLIQNISSSLYTELDILSLPSKSFYGEYLFKPISTIRVAELKIFGTWWITFVLVGVVFYLLKKLINFIFFKPLTTLISNKYSKPIGNTVRLIMFAGLGIILALPTATSAIFLGGSRLEDRIALNATGIPGIESLAFHPELFLESTGIWIALLIILMRLLKGLTDRGWMIGLARLNGKNQQVVFENLENNNPVGAFLIEGLGTRAGRELYISDRSFRKEPFSYALMSPIIDDLKAGFNWALLAFLFLPLSLSYSIIYFWLVPIFVGGVEGIKSLNKAKQKLSNSLNKKKKEKAQLRKKYASIPSDELWNRIIKILANYFRIRAASITPRTSFVDDLNIDSLDIAELVVKAEKEFSIKISNQEIETMPLVGDTYYLIKKKVNKNT